MKLRYLLEGFSDTLYHGTSLGYAVSIVNSSKFVLSEIKDTSANKRIQAIREKYPYSMSMARSIRSGYIMSSLPVLYDDAYVVFEIDGRKLSHKYKGEPLDFFSLSHNERIKRGEKAKNPFKFFELEERLYSKEKEINDFNKYIKAIHVLLSNKDQDRKRDDRDILHMKKKAEYINKLKKITSIPIYGYGNKKNFFLLKNGRRL